MKPNNNLILKICIFILVILTILVLKATVGFAQSIVFTGDAYYDFKTGPNVPPGVYVVNDLGGIGDVGFPESAPDGTISGWDIDAVYFYYDYITDIMYVGFDFGGEAYPNTICGDADGDGDPSSTSPWLADYGGKDNPNIEGTESVVLLLDTDNDGHADVAIGVTDVNDISSFAAYMRTQAIGFFLPSYSDWWNDTPLDNEVMYYSPIKDLEFIIRDFSTLPNFNFSPSESFKFGMLAFAGSMVDDGIGEEFVPSANGVSISFIYTNKPEPPMHSLPYNNSYLNDDTPTLKWIVPSDSDGDSLYFKVEIAIDSSFISQIAGSPFESHHNKFGFAPYPPVVEGFGNCSFTPINRLTNGEYWWRVSAWDGIFYSDPSESQKFTIDTRTPNIDQINMVNPHYGNHWFNQKLTDSVIVQIQYDELHAYFASLETGELGDPAGNINITSGKDQTTSFVVNIAGKSDGCYTLTARITDTAENNGLDSIEICLDESPPTGTTASSLDTSTSTTFTVSWEGSSDSTGSGLSGKYDVRVKVDNGEWKEWKTKFSGKFDNYTGVQGRTYSFEAVAWDNVNNRENFTGIPETTTKVDTTIQDHQAPIAPVHLCANGDRPRSPWQKDQNFTITWQNPYDPSGITRCLYQLGREPEHNYDALATASDTFFSIKATKDEGQMLYVWLEDGKGNLDFHNNSSVELRYDIKPPKVDFLSPKPGDILNQTVEIRANISDTNLYKYLLEYRMSHLPQWEHLDSTSFSNLFNVYSIHQWDNPSDSGEVYLRLTVWDIVNNVTSITVPFILDNKNYLPTAKIITPEDNAYLHDFVSVKGIAMDVNFTKYSLRLKGKDLNTILVEKYIQEVNEELCTFNSGSYPDGEYTLQLIVYNDRQYQNIDTVSIIIDNTFPIAKLIYPLSDTISCFVQIQGIASDSNLDNITLKRCKVGETDTAIIADLNVIDELFYTEWNTMDFNGYYSLYLSVRDCGGLTARDSRTYYINNPTFDPRKGLKKSQDEFSLYIPPNGYPSSVICLEKKSIDEFELDPEIMVPTNLICEIHSGIEETSFNKPVAFTIDYHKVNLNSCDESKLKIFKYESDEWKLIGGTLDQDTKMITAPINEIGIYGLFESKKEEDDVVDKGFQLDCQPRMFSPRGDGNNTETNIYFNLGKDSNVTIKIFNLAGRLVNTLCENKFMTSGMSSIAWDGKDSSGSYCISGLYVVFIEAEEEKASKAVMVLNK